MGWCRRWRGWVGRAVLLAVLAGCAGHAGPDAARSLAAADAAVLAPRGELRVGVYAGSPTSLVRKPGEAPAGLAHDLGLALGQQLGVPVRLSEYARAAQVFDALKAGDIDITFTNASPQRAREAAFAAPLLQLELGFLVPAGSRLASAAQLDQPGVRVGVLQGSSSQAALPRQLAHAVVVPLASLPEVRARLQAGTLDAYATNKGILFELADGLPGSRVLEGSWGAEHLALVLPQGREAGLAALERFGQQQRASGALQQAMQRAGLRGARPVP